MSVVATFDMSRPTGSACAIHVQTRYAEYRYLNVTIAIRAMMDKHADGSCEDYIQVFEDYTQTRPLTSRLCGEGTTNVMTSENRFLIVLYSNGARSGAGITLRFTSWADSEELAVNQVEEKFASGSNCLRSALQFLIIGKYLAQ